MLLFLDLSTKEVEKGGYHDELKVYEPFLDMSETAEPQKKLISSHCQPQNLVIAGTKSWLVHSGALASTLRISRQTLIFYGYIPREEKDWLSLGNKSDPSDHRQNPSIQLPLQINYGVQSLLLKNDHTEVA